MYQLDEAQLMLQKSIRTLAREKIAPLAVEADKKQEFSWEIFQFLKEAGICSHWAPKEYGGDEASITSFCITLEELGRVDGSTAFATITFVLLGPLLLGQWCNEEQKKRYLPRVVAGKLLPSVCITEPEAGSDVASIKAKAVRQGNYYILNGTKRFVSFGPITDLSAVLAITDPTKGTKGFTSFLVEKGTPGLETGRKEDKLGMRGVPTSDLVFNDVMVPASNIVGAEGQGFTVAFSVFNQGRAGDASIAVGLAQGSLDHAIDYAKERVQFGKPIATFQGLQFMLADMATRTTAARGLVANAARLLDSGAEEAPHFCSMAKLFATDTAMEVTTNAVQVLGGYGYMKDRPVERMMRDAKLLQIVEGTSQIQRMIIARGLVGRLD